MQAATVPERDVVEEDAVRQLGCSPDDLYGCAGAGKETPGESG